MGIFNRIKDPVNAEYRLISCSASSPGAAYSNCRMEGVVTGPGVGPIAIEHNTLTAPTKKWPQPGDTLPVIVDRNDPSRLKIRWNQMPTNRERARQFAQDAAAAQAVPTPQTATAPGGIPAQAQSMIDDIIARAKAGGATVSTSYETTVVGAPGRAQPGGVGGGLTPEQAASGTGLQPATATVLAAHDVVMPAGLTGAGDGGTTDLTLDVTLADGTAYSTSMRITFSTPDKHDLICAIGRRLPVLVNPASRDQIAIDTARLA
ncbi:MAG: hypothetical protein JWO10_123 [Microbacteriaceae bacterium]|nr:hypothetical protein [Microbacteriaceae bacterium]